MTHRPNQKKIPIYTTAKNMNLSQECFYITKVITATIRTKKAMKIIKLLRRCEKDVFHILHSSFTMMETRTILTNNTVTYHFNIRKKTFKTKVLRMKALLKLIIDKAQLIVQFVFLKWMINQLSKVKTL